MPKINPRIKSIQYYYTKKEWGVVMEKEKLKILEELRRIFI